MNIFFRCDGSIKVGMGHVVRCLALADYLDNNFKCNIKFLMRKSEIGLDKVKIKYPVIKADKNKFLYEKWLIDSLKSTKSNILILDCRDGLTRKNILSLKKSVEVKIVTLDDPEDKRLEADLAFYPPVPQVKTLGWSGFLGKLYIGWECVILREEFLKGYLKPKNIVKNIFISMGATDGNQMIQTIINCIIILDIDFTITVVVGNRYPFVDELKDLIKKSKINSKLYINPKNIARIISQADFSIVSFGQIAYEVAALKIPALYVCLTEDHDKSAQLFVKSKFGISMGVYKNIPEEKLIEGIKKFLGKNNFSKFSKNTSLMKEGASFISNKIIDDNN